jgi:hypothetical protein
MVCSRWPTTRRQLEAITDHDRSTSALTLLRKTTWLSDVTAISAGPRGDTAGCQKTRVAG